MNSLFHFTTPEWPLSTDPARLKALTECGIFATSPESEFDDIIKLAALSCQCSSAMIAFAESEHLHFKSTFHANKKLLQSIAASFFIPTVHASKYIWSEPSSNFTNGVGADNSDEIISFFAGVPIKVAGGQIIGILCVTDNRPRSLSSSQEEALAALGRQTEKQLTLRRMIQNQSDFIAQRETDIKTHRQAEANLAAALSRVSLINEIGKSARSSADPATILTATIAKLGSALNAERCYFVTYRPIDNLAILGPDWHHPKLFSIAGSYRMFDDLYFNDATYLSGQTSVIHDIEKDHNRLAGSTAAALGLKAILRAPVVQGNEMTALGVAMTTPRNWTDEEIALVEAIATQARAAVETARHAIRERKILRDVLASVTEGKLILSDSNQELPLPLSPLGRPVNLDVNRGLAELRELIRVAGREVMHSDARTFDTLTAASEAGMNAIVHAGSGVATVYTDSVGHMQIRIEDRGAGISFDDLPKATLSRGFSTKASLGHGLKMILETIDRLYLLTGPDGTTVVLEQDRAAPEPIWLSSQYA